MRNSTKKYLLSTTRGGTITPEMDTRIIRTIKGETECSVDVSRAYAGITLRA